MAIHATMDAYAHRGRVKGVPYNGSRADDMKLEGNYTQAQKNVFALRLAIAKKIAVDIIEKWCEAVRKNFQGVNDFSIVEFYVGVHSNDSFKMQHFKSYAKNSDGARWSGRSSALKEFFASRTE